MAEASSSLKSSLEAVLTFEYWMAKAEAELKLSNMRCAEAIEREEGEKRRLIELEKVLEELKGEHSTLEYKVSVERELD